MAPTVLKLKFEDKGAGATAGSAWITVNGVEISPDCATYGELDHYLKGLEADIEAIRQNADAEFRRCQGENAGRPKEQ